MVVVKNMRTLRDKSGNIEGYVLEDRQGNARKMKADEVKKMIKAGDLEVINLTLTSDGRLIKKSPKPEHPVIKTEKDLENYKSADGTYIIPVEWSVYATVKVEADNLLDALNKFNEVMDDLPLSTENEYVEGSYRCSHKIPEELICAQDYCHIGTVSICKDGSILD